MAAHCIPSWLSHSRLHACMFAVGLSAASERSSVSGQACVASAVTAGQRQPAAARLLCSVAHAPASDKGDPMRSFDPAATVVQSYCLADVSAWLVLPAVWRAAAHGHGEPRVPERRRRRASSRHKQRTCCAWRSCRRVPRAVRRTPARRFAGSSLCSCQHVGMAAAARAGCWQGLSSAGGGEHNFGGMCVGVRRVVCCTAAFLVWLSQRLANALLLSSANKTYLSGSGQSCQHCNVLCPVAKK
jgi:hypothetical protein